MKRLDLSIDYMLLKSGIIKRKKVDVNVWMFEDKVQIYKKFNYFNNRFKQNNRERKRKKKRMPSS